MSDFPKIIADVAIREILPRLGAHSKSLFACVGGRLSAVKHTGWLRHFGGFLLGACLLCAPFSAFANNYSGVVWKRYGKWHLNGSSSGLRLGEAIPPGGLLTAEGAGAHSLVVLMPDGQRLLCECYEVGTCAQGFRVPALASPPSEPVWTMFAAVQNVLLMRPATAEEPFSEAAGREESAANIEMVAALNGDKVSLASALHVLPAGHYRLEVRWDGPQPRPQSGAMPIPSAQPLDWDAAQAAAQVLVPGPGLYRITVVDDSRVPRIDTELLVTSADAVASESEGLKRMRSTVMGWNRVHEGWSLHDFLRAYLQSRAIVSSQ